MDGFIKKIFEGKDTGDFLVHVQFQKFSRGEFKDKAVVLYSKGKDKYSISTTSEYANEMVRMLAERVMNDKLKVTGAVITTRDLKGELDFTSIKQFAGVKQYQINKEMTGKEIVDLCDKFPTAFMALSFITKDAELKIKSKAPKSGKPSTKENVTPKADFCKLIAPNKELIKAFVFDAEIPETAKKVEINHVFQITDIILPKNETDPAKLREKAERKGKVIRTLKMDEKIIKKEHVFLA